MSVVRKSAAVVVEAASQLLEELAIEAPEDIDVPLIAAHCGLFTFPGRLANEEGHLSWRTSGSDSRLCRMPTPSTFRPKQWSAGAIALPPSCSSLLH